MLQLSAFNIKINFLKILNYFPPVSGLVPLLVSVEFWLVVILIWVVGLWIVLLEIQHLFCCFGIPVKWYMDSFHLFLLFFFTFFSRFERFSPQDIFFAGYRDLMFFELLEKSLNSLDVYWGPLSLLNLKGIQWRANMDFIYVVTVLLLVFLSLTTSKSL